MQRPLSAVLALLHLACPSPPEDSSKANVGLIDGGGSPVTDCVGVKRGQLNSPVLENRPAKHYVRHSLGSVSFASLRKQSAMVKWLVVSKRPLVGERAMTVSRHRCEMSR
jgi:hypothetical protein